MQRKWESAHLVNVFYDTDSKYISYLTKYGLMNKLIRLFTGPSQVK